MHPSKPLLAVVMGNIGAGKTTTCEILARAIGGDIAYEPVDENPYLERFYAEPDKYAFPLQVFMLSHRLRAAVQTDWATGLIWQDRYVREDRDIFAVNLHDTGIINNDDWKTYNHIYDTMTPHFLVPDLYVYLKASVPTLQSRIAKRARECEAAIPETYLAQLNVRYAALAEAIRAEKDALVIEVDMDDLDLTDPAHAAPVIEKVRAAFGAKALIKAIDEHGSVPQTNLASQLRDLTYAVRNIR